MTRSRRSVHRAALVLVDDDVAVSAKSFSGNAERPVSQSTAEIHRRIGRPFIAIGRFQRNSIYVSWLHYDVHNSCQRRTAVQIRCGTSQYFNLLNGLARQTTPINPTTKRI